MFFSDLTFIVIFWFYLQFLAILILPSSLSIFKNQTIFGWTFAKIFGFLIPSYVLWILGSYHLITFSERNIFVLTIVVGVLVWFVSLVKKNNIFDQLYKQRLTIFIIEFLFFTSLLLFTIIRGFRPEIFGLEKFMDFGFINSIIKSNYFPPDDMWFAQKSINYYYFGHLNMAFLIKFTTFSPAVAFNLLISTIFGLVIISAFAIGKVLTGNLFFGLVTAIFISILGNLHTITILKTGLERYWFANASRIDPFVINEFPIYGFIVSDLHAHLLNIPIVLTFIAISILWFGKEKFSVILFFATALILGAIYATNSWDFPIYLTLISSVIIINVLRSKKISLEAFLKAAAIIIAILALSLILFLPFYLNFTPLTSGIGIVSQKSSFKLLFLMWGFYGFLISSFLLFMFAKIIKSRDNDYFYLIILFIGLAILLITIPEFLYVKDIYIQAYFRANTMFKLYFQAWILLSISGSFGLYLIIKKFTNNLNLLKLGWFIIFLLLFLISLSYPAIAIKSFYNLPANYKGINGLSYLKHSSPEDFMAIEWFWQNATNQVTIVEAVGDSYSEYGRISANTGLPTIVGWPVHEWLWRGSYDPVGERVDDVSKIYESGDASTVRQLLTKHQVKYIYIGGLERTKYPNIDEAKIRSLGKEVARFGKSYILEFN